MKKMPKIKKIPFFSLKLEIVLSEEANIAAVQNRSPITELKSVIKPVQIAKQKRTAGRPKLRILIELFGLMPI